jgi:hypothetical protein
MLNYSWFVLGVKCNSLAHREERNDVCFCGYSKFMLQRNLQHSFCEISESSMQMALLLFTSEARLLDAFGKSKFNIELCQFWSQKTEVDLQTTVEYHSLVHAHTCSERPRDSQSPPTQLRYGAVPTNTQIQSYQSSRGWSSAVYAGVRQAPDPWNLSEWDTGVLGFQSPQKHVHMFQI